MFLSMYNLSFFFVFFFFFLFVFSFFLFVFFKIMNLVLLMEWFFYFFSYEMSFLIYFDWLGLMFMGLVCLISFFIFNYNMYYCENYKNMGRFVFLVFCFVLSMLFLIFTPNLLSLMLGWDGLGLSSYLLVCYYSSKNSYLSGMITILSNRLGDGLMIILIGFVLFDGYFNLFIYGGNVGFIEMLFFLMACMTKSAQVPFVAWLPLAMAAPTPVSALVHSSTLVTAGIYLIFRSDLNFLDNHGLSTLLMISSLLTSFFSSLCACLIVDFKKIVAMSTMSQLGLMMYSLSLGMNDFCFFHVLSHAIFKSIMFMWVGFFMVENFHVQDFRFYNYSYILNPMLSVCFMSVHMCLFGFPFLASFYSKDKLLECGYNIMMSNLVMMLLMFISGMTLSYSIRMMLIGASGYKMSFVKEISSKDFDYYFIYMFVMFFISLFMSYYMYWSMVDYLYLNFYLFNLEKFGLLYLMLFMFFFGFFISNYLMYFYNFFFFGFFMFYINFFVNFNLYKKLYSGYNYYVSVDKGFLDYINIMLLNLLKNTYVKYLYGIQNFYFLSGFFFVFFLFFFI